MSTFPSNAGYPQAGQRVPVLPSNVESSGGHGPNGDTVRPGPSAMRSRLVGLAEVAGIIAFAILLLYLLYALFQQFAPSHLRPGQVIGRTIGDIKEAFDSVTAETAAKLEAVRLQQEAAQKIQLQDFELRVQERLKILDAQLNIATQAAAKNYEVAAQYQKLNAEMLGRMAQVRIDQYQSQEAGRAVALMFFDLAGAAASIAGNGDYAATIEQRRNQVQAASVGTIRSGMDEIYSQMSALNPVGTLVSPAQLNQQLAQSPTAVAPFPHTASAPTLQGGVVSPFKKTP